MRSMPFTTSGKIAVKIGWRQHRMVNQVWEMTSWNIPFKIWMILNAYALLRGWGKRGRWGFRFWSQAKVSPTGQCHSPVLPCGLAKTHQLDVKAQVLMVARWRGGEEPPGRSKNPRSKKNAQQIWEHPIFSSHYIGLSEKIGCSQIWCFRTGAQTPIWFDIELLSLFISIHHFSFRSICM